MPYKNLEKKKEYDKKWGEKNKRYLKIYRKNYYQNNKERLKEYANKWRKENPEKARKYSRKHNRKWYQKNKQRRKINPKFRLDSCMAKAICRALEGRKNKRKWQALVGYTLEDLRKHLEGKFDDKMSWENYGSYWHLDHIKPKSLFKYKKPEDPEFKKCWSLKNLQPLERIANLKKNNKYVCR